MILKKYTKSVTILVILFSLILLLSGCSPHPGAGNWIADGSNTLNIARFNVVFEGTADFYINDKKESVRRCFWSAVDERQLQMQCVHSGNIENKVIYQFKVSESGQGKLTEDDKLIGLFIPTSITEVSEEKTPQN